MVEFDFSNLGPNELNETFLSSLDLDLADRDADDVQQVPIPEKINKDLAKDGISIVSYWQFFLDDYDYLKSATEYDRRFIVARGKKGDQTLWMAIYWYNIRSYRTHTYPYLQDPTNTILTITLSEVGEDGERILWRDNANLGWGCRGHVGGWRVFGINQEIYSLANRITIARTGWTSFKCNNLAEE